MENLHIELLKQINQKLDIIINLINKTESAEYIAEEQLKEFIINVAADLFVENMKNKKNI